MSRQKTGYPQACPQLWTDWARPMAKKASKTTPTTPRQPPAGTPTGQRTPRTRTGARSAGPGLPPLVVFPRRAPCSNGAKPRPCTKEQQASEAHLPAEYAEAQQDPWLPQAHVHSRRPGNHQASPREGPRPALRVGRWPRAGRRRPARQAQPDHPIRRLRFRISSRHVGGGPAPRRLRVQSRRGGSAAVGPVSRQASGRCCGA